MALAAVAAGADLLIVEVHPRPDPYKALKALEKDKKRRSDVLLVPVPRRIGAWTKAEIPVETFRD